MRKVQVNREKDKASWLEFRQTHVGSSEITTICGLNPYQTPLELWAIKTGKLDDIQESPAMKYGRLVEHAIVEIFRDLHPEFFVEENSSTYVSEEAEFATATPDAFLRLHTSDALGLLECKHTARFADWEEGGAPNYAHLQLQWQLGVMGFAWGHIGAVCGGRVNEFKDPYFQFEPEIWDACLEQARSFMEAVSSDIPPRAGAGDSKILEQLLALREESVQVEDQTWTSKYRYVLEKLKALKVQAESLESAKKTLENQIKQTLGGASVGKFTDGSEVRLKKISVNPTAKPYSFIRLFFREKQANGTE